MFTLRETKISKTLQGQQKDIPVQSKQRAEKQNTKKWDAWMMPGEKCYMVLVRSTLSQSTKKSSRVSCGHGGSPVQLTLSTFSTLLDTG